MTIATDQQITFQEIRDAAWSYIYNRCQNLDKYNIPAAAKSGWNTTYKNDGTGTPGDQGTGQAAGGGATVSIDNSTIIPQYSGTDAYNNFISFLQSRNVYNKDKAVITSNGIITFWNAVACFCASNVVILVGEWFTTGSNCIVYKPNNNYAPSPTTQDTPNMNNNNINDLLGNLETILSKNTKVHRINYNVSTFSSCSSCSSSSHFIGYIKI